MGVDPLGDPGADGNAAHHLADALPGVDPRKTALGLLPAHEQRPRPPPADVQGQEAGELGPDRHLAPLAALATADDDHTLDQTDVLDPHLDQLRDPCPGLEQSLQHETGPSALGVGLVDEPELLLKDQPVDAATAIGGCGEPELLARNFEHRLALQVVDALASQDGGDRGGDALETPHDGLSKYFLGCKLMPVRGDGRQVSTPSKRARAFLS